MLIHILDLSLISLAKLSIKSESTKFLRENLGDFLFFKQPPRLKMCLIAIAVKQTIISMTSAWVSLCSSRMISHQQISGEHSASNSLNC